MAGTPDLFVVCKKCGSEVSPYITECPYCGTRLRKRAPKIERHAGEGTPRAKRSMPRPSLSPLRHGEIPGIRADPTRRPYVTGLIVALSLLSVIVLVWVGRVDVALTALSDKPERLATAPFFYPNSWYQIAIIVPVGLFGWRLELRHGPGVVLVLFLLCGVGGNALAAELHSNGFILGAPGAALGLLAAWAVPDLWRLRRGEEHDGDLIGVLVLGLVVAAMPLATTYASAIATYSGGAAGLLVGLLLSRTSAARR
jgi:hypothetical protein